MVVIILLTLIGFIIGLFYKISLQTKLNIQACAEAQIALNQPTWWSDAIIDAKYRHLSAIAKRQRDKNAADVYGDYK